MAFSSLRKNLVICGSTTFSCAPLATKLVIVRIIGIKEIAVLAVRESIACMHSLQDSCAQN